MSAELNLIIGCMFSGKTTELLRIAKRLKAIEQRVLLINYGKDTRYSQTEMMTHDREGLPSLFVETFTTDIYNTLCNYDIVCINEAQFFPDLVQFCKCCLSQNKTVYASGLDGDYKQEPFGDILKLIPLCNHITKLHAFCKICKNKTPAYFTKRITEDTEQMLIGTEQYIPVCREHL